MPNQGQKTPDELQEEIEHTRAELDSTLDEIGRRLSPREIKERTVGYVKETAESLSETLQRNPVPVAIAGTALAATLLARHRASTRVAREREEQFTVLWDRLVDAIERKPSAFSAGDTMSRLSNLATDAKDELSRTLSTVLAEVQRRGSDALGEARHLGNGLAARAHETSRAAGEHAQRLGSAAGARAHELGRTAGESAHHLGETAGDAAERLLGGVATSSRTHPYLTAIVALASGAVLLAALRR